MVQKTKSALALLVHEVSAGHSPTCCGPIAFRLDVFGSDLFLVNPQKEISAVRRSCGDVNPELQGLSRCICGPFIHSCTYLHLLGTYYVPGSVQDPGVMGVTRK